MAILMASLYRGGKLKIAKIKTQNSALTWVRNGEKNVQSILLIKPTNK